LLYLLIVRFTFKKVIIHFIGVYVKQKMPSSFGVLCVNSKRFDIKKALQKGLVADGETGSSSYEPVTALEAHCIVGVDLSDLEEANFGIAA